MLCCCLRSSAPRSSMTAMAPSTRLSCFLAFGIVLPLIGVARQQGSVTPFGVGLFGAGGGLLLCKSLIAGLLVCGRAGAHDALGHARGGQFALVAVKALGNGAVRRDAPCLWHRRTQKCRGSFRVTGPIRAH
jgi:hypothetical protein